MATLPSNTFMFNYNARFYDPTTHTILKTTGQLFDSDLVLNRTVAAYADDYVVLGVSNAYMGVTYQTASQNPFNRDSSHNSFTFIYKTSGFTAGNKNIIANRGSDYNYMVRPTMFHTSQSSFLSFAPTTNPQIFLIRVSSNGFSERKELDANGNVLQSVTSSTISWGNASNAFGFFSGYGNKGTELFTDTFYWMYCSLETLTDAEVKQVIAYNENSSSFAVSETALTGSYQTTAFTVSLTANDNTTWSATTIPSWITVSPSSGTTSTTLTITFSQNNTYSQRTGTIEFTDSESNTCSIECTQTKHPLLIPNNNIYRGDLIVS